MIGGHHSLSPRFRELFLQHLILLHHSRNFDPTPLLQRIDALEQRSADVLIRLQLITGLRCMASMRCNLGLGAGSGFGDGRLDTGKV